MMKQQSSRRPRRPRRRTLVIIMMSMMFHRKNNIWMCTSFVHNPTVASSSSSSFCRRRHSLNRWSSIAGGAIINWNPRRIHGGCCRQLSSSSSSSSEQQQQQQQQQQATSTQRTTLVSPTIYESELVVKKSRFIGFAKHVKNWGEAQSFIDECKTIHPKARHWCTAYRGLVDGIVTERCDDDGEPSGTAGQPILNALHTEGDLIDVVCVVVRYFGGIKLGAGGLIRAYGGCARQVLRDSEKQILIPTTTFVASEIQAQYVGAVYDCLSKCSTGNALPSKELYGEDGTMSLSITCQTDQLQRLQSNLQDSTRGSIVFSEDLG